MVRIIILIFFLFPIASLARGSDASDDFSMMEEYFSEEVEDDSDPFESFNRAIFAFNRFSYDYFFKHAVDVYSFVTPNFLERGFVNFFHNLEKPYITLSSLLKLDPENAGIVFSTFMINSTFGLLGFFDLTSSENIKYKSINFDDVLGFYQIPKGPYMILPFLGSSTLRGTVVLGLKSRLNYHTQDLYLEDNYNRYVSYAVLKNLTSLSTVSEYVDNIYNNSMDPYSTIKSYYLQRK
jgi:phospholipid-binding lipoprotein MlaA